MFNIKTIFNDIKERIEKEKCYVDGYDYNDLQTKNELTFVSNIEEKNMKYFKYINKEAKIKFIGDNYDNIFKCIKILLDNEVNNIEINLYFEEPRDKFDNYIKANNMEFNIDNVKLNIGYNEVPIKKYKECEKLLNTIIKPAINLSPLEKFVYVYNIVKKFKKYKEDEDDLRNARDLYKILYNDYIVCVGFGHLQKELLKKLDINCTLLPTYLYGEEKVDGHMRIYTYLKDDKYGINGFYISDPTFDNFLNVDLYNHMLYTDRKNNYHIQIENINQHFIFNSNSIYEYNRNFEICKKILKKDEITLFENIMNKINNLDPQYIKKLKEKYNIIDKYKYLIHIKQNDYKKLLELKEELGYYIIEKVNNEIDNNKIKDAIRVIYEKFYGFQDKNKLNEELEKVYNYNDEIENEVFPFIEKDKELIKKLY